jgi:hypothetical protein
LSWNGAPLGAHGAAGDLGVLLADRPDHVARGQAAGGEGVGVQPHPHGVVAGAEDAHAADPGQAAQLVLHRQGGVVGQGERIHAAVRRDQVDDHGQVAGPALGRHAQAADLLGQAGGGAADPVLHLDQGRLHVGAQAEGQGQGHLAVGGGVRRLEEQAGDAGELLLQGPGDGVRHRLR